MRNFLAWLLSLTLSVPLVPGGGAVAQAADPIPQSEVVDVDDGMTQFQRDQWLRDRYAYHLFFDPYPVVVGPDSFFGSLAISWRDHSEPYTYPTADVGTFNRTLQDMPEIQPHLQMGERFLRHYLSLLSSSFYEYEPWARHPLMELKRMVERPQWVVEQHTVKPTEREAAQRAWQEVVESHHLDPEMEYQELVRAAETQQRFRQALDDYNRLFFLFLDDEKIVERRVDEFDMERLNARVQALIITTREQNFRSAIHHLNKLGDSRFLLDAVGERDTVRLTGEDLARATIEFVPNASIDFTHRPSATVPWEPVTVYEMRTGIPIKNRKLRNVGARFLAEPDVQPSRLPHYGVRLRVGGHEVLMSESDYTQWLTQITSRLTPPEKVDDQWFWLQRFVLEAAERDSQLAHFASMVKTLDRSWDREALLKNLDERIRQGDYHVSNNHVDSLILKRRRLTTKLKFVSPEYLDGMDPARRLYWYGVSIHPQHWELRQGMADYISETTLAKKNEALSYHGWNAFEAFKEANGTVLASIDERRRQGPRTRLRFQWQPSQLKWLDVHPLQQTSYVWSEGLYGAVETRRLADEKKKQVKKQKQDDRQQQRQERAEERRQNFNNFKQSAKEAGRKGLQWLKRLAVLGAMVGSVWGAYQLADELDINFPDIRLPSWGAGIEVPPVGRQDSGEQEMSEDNGHYQVGARPPPVQPRRQQLSQDDEHYQVAESEDGDPFDSDEGTFRAMALDNNGQQVAPPAYYNIGASYNIPQDIFAWGREFDQPVHGVQVAELRATERPTGAHVFVGNVVPFEAERGLVPILQPDHHDLVHLQVSIGNSVLTRGVDYEVFRVEQTGLYYISVERRFFNPVDGIKYQASFTPSAVNFDSDPRWSLTTQAMSPVIDDLEAIGATELAGRLRELVAEAGSDRVSVSDVEAVFSGSGLYSFRESTTRFGDSSNPFHDATSYLQDGILFYQCTGSNFVLETFLRETYANMGRTDFYVTPINGHVLKNRDGFMGPSGHRRTLVSDPSQPMAHVIVDGTPYTMDPANQTTPDGAPGFHPLPEAEELNRELSEKEEEREEEAADSAAHSGDSESEDPLDKERDSSKLVAINRRYEVPDNPALEIPYRYTPGAPQFDKPEEKTQVQESPAASVFQSMVQGDVQTYQVQDEDKEAQQSSPEPNEADVVAPKRRDYTPEIERIHSHRRGFRTWLDGFYRLQKLDDEDFVAPSMHGKVVALFKSLELIDEFFSFEITRTEFLSRLMALSSGDVTEGIDAVSVYGLARKRLVEELGGEGRAIKYLMDELSQGVRQAIADVRKEMSQGEMPEHYYLLQSQSEKILVQMLIEEFDREWFGSLIFNDDCDALMEMN